MKLKFFLVIIVSVLLNLFFTGNALAQVTIREDNVLLVDGKPFFPIGIYNTAPRPEIRDNGFNVVEGVDQIDYDEKGNVIGGTPWSDRWYEMGIEYNLMILPNMFINGHVMRCQSPTETECDPNYARDFTSYFKTKEKLLAHYPLDEPGVNWRNHPSVPELYQAIRKEDPSHPIFVVDQHWCPLKRTAEVSVGYDLDKCKKVNPNYDQWWLEEADKITHQVFGLADIVAVDHYCIWEKENGQRSDGVKEVTLAMDWAREKVADQKPVWFVVQAFSHGAFDGYVDHWPTFEEERAMVYLALNHGAKGIFYYDWSLMRNPDTDTFKSAEAEKLWNDIGRINKELNSLVSVIIAPKVEQTVASPDSEIDLYLRHYEDRWYLFAVNAEDRAVDAVFNLPADWLATSAEVYNENRIISIADSQFKDIFAPAAVHIYVISPTSTPIPGDTNRDGVVDSEDFALLVEDYLKEPVHNTDFNSDGRVDSEDFAILQSNYLKEEDK